MKKFLSILSALFVSVATTSAAVSCASKPSNNLKPSNDSNPVNVTYVNRIKTNKKVIMLTFDDGPLPFNTKATDPATPDDSVPGPEDKPGYTVDDEILDVLEKNSKYSVDGKEPIPGTFFEVGSHIAKRYKDHNLTTTMNRILESGSWIGSHTYNHDRYKNKPQKYFFDDISKSYKMVDDFYKEYFLRKHTGTEYPVTSKVESSNKSIADLNITSDGKTNDVYIPLRLGFLQWLPWKADFVKKFHIVDLMCGGFETDWKETKNATVPALQDYFSKNGWGDYKQLKAKYDNATDDDKKLKWATDFANHKTIAERDISKNIILKEYEKQLSKGGGQVLVCHTRTFAKYWLPELIGWAHNQGFQFVGMNPYNKISYYGNWGKLIS